MASKIELSAIPLDLAEQQTKSRFNARFLLGGTLLLLLVGYLLFQMIQATTTTGAYFMTVNEVLTTPNLQGQRIRVNGNVTANSEDWKPQEMTLKFAIQDEEGGKALPIVFYGPRPDNFQRAASAIVEGNLLPDGSFQAETLLLKCPSRYEEQPEQVFVKSTR